MARIARSPAAIDVTEPMAVTAAAPMPASDVLTALGASEGGLTTPEVRRRLTALGPNAVRSHRARLL